MSSLRECYGRGDDVPQLSQVKDLHSAGWRFTDYERVIVVNLNVPPGGVRTVRWQVAEVNRVHRVADINERRPGGTAHNGVFLTVSRVGPSPNVITNAAADLIQGQKRHQVHVAAGIDASEAADA